MKKLRFFLSFAAAVFICITSVSCVYNVDACRDSAIEYLEACYPNQTFEYTGMSQEPTVSGFGKVRYFFYKTAAFEIPVTVRVVKEKDEKNSSYLKIESNYKALYFEKQEKAFYKTYLDKYFSKSTIYITNYNRFFSDYKDVYIFNDQTQEWELKHKELIFESYMHEVLEKRESYIIEFSVEQPKNEFLTAKDYLNNLLMDFSYNQLFFSFYMIFERVEEGGGKPQELRDVFYVSPVLNEAGNMYYSYW